MGTATPGEILLGKYRVDDVIGVGGMGQVVKASHMYLQQYVAIKILLPAMVESASTVQRFLREAQATVRLRSEHIARVMDVGTLPDGAPFMVMEFLDGFDLNQILRHHGPQLAQPVVDLMLQACEGISEAHALGIVHRDIKPSNFFITRRPDGSNLLKILDFGISKTPAEMSELTGTQTVIGTPTYMAPEQMRMARSTDPRSDIWSMGVVMYQMLAGRPPFEAETYAELVIKVGTEKPSPLQIALPPGLDSIVLRCLEKDPNARFQNVGELARMLAPYASDPLSAQQSAERATRILTTPRNSAMSLSSASVGSGGMGLTPPPALTPKSWNNTGGSSLSGGAGQMGTRQTRKSNRGLVIAGVASLCIAAGVGGFVVANSMGKAHDATTSTEKVETVMQPTTAPQPPAGAGGGSAAPADIAKAAGSDAAKVDAAKTDAAKADASKSDASKSKTDIAKSDASKSDASKSKTDAAKSDASKSKTDTAKSDASKSKTDIAKSDASKSDATKADASKTKSDAAKSDASKSKTDIAKADASKSDATVGSDAAAKAKADAAAKAKADAIAKAKAKAKADAAKTKTDTTKKPDDDLFGGRH